MALGSDFQQEVDLPSCSRTSPTSSCRSAWSPRRRRTSSTARCGSRRPTRSATCIIIPNDVQEAAVRGAAARARRRAVLRARRRAPARRCPDPRPAARRPPRSSTPARRSRSSSARAPRAPRAEVEQVAETARRRRRQGAQRPRGAARRPALRDRLDRPARDEAVERHDARAATRCSWSGRASRTRSGCPSPGQARGVQIDIDAPADRHALPDGGQPRRRRRGDARGAAAAARAQGGPLLARGDRGGRRRAGGRSSTTARTSRPTRSTRSSSSTSSPSGCPTARSSPRDSGSATNWWARHLRMRDGMTAALSGHARDDVPGGARTRWRRSSRTPTGR